ncbi:MAG: tRNA (adenosine(37)-N6)-threonylcarbamoyltransferase complex dimerization subunit type 1 TsaB [Thermoanaerobaculia bacterium]
MPTWLAFDAGSPVTSAAVARDGAVLGESSGEGRSGPSLLLHIDDCLRRAGVATGELDGIVVLSGPGSFTGIRVALATALGFRAGLDAPVVALSNLAALALQVDPADRSPVLALIDALRAEWFAQEFRREGRILTATSAPERLPSTGIVAPRGAYLALHQGQTPPSGLTPQGLRHAAALAPSVAAAASDESLARVLSVELEPLYLRGFTPRNART